MSHKTFTHIGRDNLTRQAIHTTRAFMPKLHYIQKLHLFTSLDFKNKKYKVTINMYSAYSK